MLLDGIHANSIHSLRELSHAIDILWSRILCLSMAMHFFLIGGVATRRGEDCGGLEGPLTRL